MSQAPPSERAIVVIASSEPSERCLHFKPAAVPEDFKVERRLVVRGANGRRVVKGHIATGAPAESVVLASPGVCRQVTAGTAGEKEFDAFISKARWRDSLADLEERTLLTIAGVGIVCLGSLTGAYVAFSNSSADFGIAALLLGVVCIGILVKAFTDAFAALAIATP